MDIKKIFGIIFIILGLLFVIYPLYTGAAISLVTGICLIAFGFASIIEGFSIFSIMTNFSAIDILLGICAILFGLLFIYKIDALSFIVGYTFYLIAFVFIFSGILSFFVGSSSMSKLSSVLIIIMGIVALYLAAFSISQPLYTAVIVGICLILEGILFLASDVVERDEITS